MSSGEQRDIRYAAETLYRNAQQSQSQSQSQSQPQPGPSRYVRSNHNPNLDLLSLVNEDYIAGYTQDGQMSTVRRFFCLFVIFDLFFISMLWFLCIMMRGETIINAFNEQVLNYTIQKSLFDIILAALVRFILLITFYGVFAINHWCIIAFTTTASCAFLIGKVLYYDWVVPVQPIIQVLMIIVSCLLAWGEAWFLDCRVIPQEKNAQRFYRLFMAQSHDNERAPLLESYLNYHHSAQTDATGSVANFYSPIESVHNSDLDDDDVSEDDLYKSKGFADVQAAYELMECIDWKLEKIVTSTGDRIQSIQRKKLGKIYRLTGQVNLSAGELFRRLYNGMEDVPSWNPTVLQARVLRKIDSHTDITYSLSAPAAGGLVESRDFVDLRHWRLMKNGQFVDDDDFESDQLTSVNEFHRQTKDNVDPMKKSSSEVNLMDTSIMDQSINSLSKSLGAGVFSDVESGSPAPEMYKSKTTSEDIDEFVDANESQDVPSTTESSHRSEEAEPIQGIVSDFCDKMYIVSGTSIKYEAMPKVPPYERAENIISCWAARESKTNPHVCTLDFLMCLDLKGRIPRFVLDKAYINVMQEFMSHLRKYIDSIEATA